MRLDKFLCDMGEGTRSQVKQKIRKGCVTVDGQAARKPELSVTAENRICMDGRPVSYVKLEYYMLNKPAGVLSATRDPDQPTVLSLIRDKRRKDLFPAGRLDKDTEGLLLITNDGVLAHSLLSPKKHVDKRYYAKVAGVVTEEHVRLFAGGLDLGDEKPALPAVLEIQKAGKVSHVFVTLREGRYHQVKRMFQAVGCEVLYLKRLSMGSLCLDESLKPGEYRSLTQEEVENLKDNSQNQENHKC